eukprot:15333632-Ditylum_brightwellii.AAC.1
MSAPVTHHPDGFRGQSCAPNQAFHGPLCTPGGLVVKVPGSYFTESKKGEIVLNCIIVFNKIISQQPNGGMALNHVIMLHLLNMIHEFLEFCVVSVIDLVPWYTPTNND